MGFAMTERLHNAMRSLWGIAAGLLVRFLKNLGRNIKATGLYFLLGYRFQRYVPAETMTAVFGGNEA